MLFDAYMHWKNNVELDLWPMAISFAAYIYNHTPKNHVFSADVLYGSVVPHHHLKDLHVWDCPVFVLNPKIQQGQTLPRWEARSKKGMFMRFS